MRALKLNRRQFYQVSGLFGLSLVFQAKLRAEEQCTDLKDFEGAVSWSNEKINYWIDGVLFERSDLKRKIYLAILLKHQQSVDSFIDKVIFTDESKKIIEARYFDEADKISSGFLPYLIFNGLSLDQSRYFLYVQVRGQDGVQKYRYTFSSSAIKKSKLDQKHLPAKIRNDLIESHLATISSFFYMKNKLAQGEFMEHNIMASLLALNSNNEFSIQVQFIHKDLSLENYIRYILITDPVGRVLGIHERKIGDPEGSVIVKALTEEERNRWGLTADKVAKINDCPYVMAFMEDVQDSISKTTLWLR